MSVLVILEEIVVASNEALDTCHKYPNAATKNMDVAKMLKIYLNAAQQAIIELHKGNVK